jgi:hypothetical protein
MTVGKGTLKFLCRFCLCAWDNRGLAPFLSAIPGFGKGRMYAGLSIVSIPETEQGWKVITLEDQATDEQLVNYSVNR